MSGVLLWLVRAMACIVLVGVSACGGGGGGDPGTTPLSQKTISGTVVSGGKVLANAEVYVWCNIRSGLTGQVPTENAVLTFYTTTGSNGDYSTRVDAATAPCIVEAKEPVQGTTLHSYVSAFDSSDVTANVTPITDSILAITLGTGNFSSVTNNLKVSVINLSRELLKGTDVAAWASMRTKLLSGTYISAAADINAMPSNPVTGTLTPVTVGTVPAGYFRLLQRLAVANIDSSVLQAITQEARFVEVPGTGGTEVQDLKTRWIWQRCVMGMKWTGTTCGGTPAYLTRSEANAAIAREPLSPVTRGAAWQMASSLALQPLLTTNGASSSLDPVWFPNDPGWWTWLGGGVAPPYVGSVLHTQSGILGVSNNDGTIFRAPSTGPLTTNTGKYLVRLFRAPI